MRALFISVSSILIVLDVFVALFIVRISPLARKNVKSRLGFAAFFLLSAALRVYGIIVQLQHPSAHVLDPWSVGILTLTSVALIVYLLGVRTTLENGGS